MTARCIHFGTCGGCSLQNLGAADYAAAKRALVQTALMQAGVTAEVGLTLSVPPRTRRRAVFKVASTPGGIVIGFHAAKSHDIVDMRECLVLTPGLFNLAQQLRERLASVLADGEKCDLHVTECESGFDLAFRSPRNATPALTAAMAQALAGTNCARVSFNGAVMLEDDAPRVRFDDVTVELPPQAFLQSSVDGEALLREHVQKIVGKAKNIADLFAGCGTFALPLAKKARVHAVEQDGPALAALAAGAKALGLKPVTTETRDLFKLPLTLPELNAYDAVVMDPPRAGAQTQAQMLAKSRVPVIAYVSCDAQSFARDAAILVAGGYRIGTVTPVDQFLWSSHIELVAGFTKKKP